MCWQSRLNYAKLGRAKLLQPARQLASKRARSLGLSSWFAASQPAGQPRREVGQPARPARSQPGNQLVSQLSSLTGWLPGSMTGSMAAGWPSEVLTKSNEILGVREKGGGVWGAVERVLVES